MPSDKSPSMQDDQDLTVAYLAGHAAARSRSIRPLTSGELADCCGGCRTNSAIETWMRRAIEKFCEVNGIRLDAPGVTPTEPSELNLWTRQWRDELIRKARADSRKYDAAWSSLNDKSTDYAKSIKMARDVCAQVLALWESSPVDLPAHDSGVLVLGEGQQ